jgi:hypothetical protein
VCRCFGSGGYVAGGILLRSLLREGAFLIKFGGDLLSHVLRRSTIGAVALNGRVRDGIGCFAHAVTTKPAKKRRAFFSRPGRDPGPRWSGWTIRFGAKRSHQLIVPSLCCF